MKQGLVRLLYNFCKRFMGWTLHTIMCVLLCYPVSIHMSQLLSTGRPISSFMKKMMFLSKTWYFSVQKALIYYTVNKSHHNSFILLVFSHVANFRYAANFRFLTLTEQPDV